MRADHVQHVKVSAVLAFGAGAIALLVSLYVGTPADVAIAQAAGWAWLGLVPGALRELGQAAGARWPRFAGWLEALGILRAGGRAEWSDMAANLAGVMIGSLAWRALAFALSFG